MCVCVSPCGKHSGWDTEVSKQEAPKDSRARAADRKAWLWSHSFHTDSWATPPFRPLRGAGEARASWSYWGQPLSVCPCIQSSPRTPAPAQYATSIIFQSRWEEREDNAPSKLKDKTQMRQPRALGAGGSAQQRGRGPGGGRRRVTVQQKPQREQAAWTETRRTPRQSLDIQASG